MSDSKTHVVNSRRSQRVAARIRVKVTRRGGEDSTLSEETNTLVVNAHGGAILLAMSVQVGDILVLQNLTTCEEVLIRVAHVGEKQDLKYQVGIEFTNPAPHFWQIDFPPKGWKVLED
jgi:hypothetical protein